MLGKKCSLAPLKEELRKQGVSVRRPSTALRLARPFPPKHVCQRKRGSLEQLVSVARLLLSETEPRTNMTLWNQHTSSVTLIHPGN